MSILLDSPFLFDPLLWEIPCSFPNFLIDAR